MSAYGTLIASLEPTYRWNLADASGSSTASDSADSSPGTPHGTVAFGAGSGPETFGTVATLAAGYITTTAEASGLTSAGYTALVWFRTSASGPQGLLNYGNASSASFTDPLFIDTSGHLRSGNYCGSVPVSTIASTEAVNDGNWHMACAVVTNSSLTLYLDGVEVGSTTGSHGYGLSETGWILGLVAGNSPNWPGLPSTGTLFPFTGSLAEGAVWVGGGPTGAEIAELYETVAGVDISSLTLSVSGEYDALMAAAPGLISWFPLSGAPFDDIVTGLNLPEQNGPPSFVPGPGGSALAATEFDSNCYLGEAYDPSAVPDLSYGIELWIRPTLAPSAYGTLLADGGTYYSVFIDPTGHINYVTYYGGYQEPLTSPSPLALNVWHHLLLSVDADSECSMFLDGDLVGHAYMPKSDAYQYLSVAYGYNPEASYCYAPPGTQMAHLAFYSVAPSLSFAQSHYEKGLVGFWSPKIGSPDISYGSMHITAGGMEAARGGRVLTAGGARVGRRLPPMLVRRGALGR